ncbi:MAG: hypothetical protein ACI83W_000267 [Marinoscillum sp.]|jgi:uncharacterized protein YbjT (DUF2867 family)
MANKTAVVLGSTGLVGNELVNLLVESSHYTKVKIITRRKLSGQESDKVEQVLIQNLDDLESFSSRLSGDDYYCAIGTTIKKAGSKEAFSKVDHDYPISFAKVALSHPSFSQYLIVTAAGSDPKSSIFYNKVKGQVEKALMELKLPSLSVFRPTLLLGDRSEYRFGEVVMTGIVKVFTFFLSEKSSAVIAIQAEAVANAMLKVAATGKSGINAYSSKEMVGLARK